MDSSSDVVSVEQMKHIYFSAESRVGARNHVGRTVSGIKMIFSSGAKIHRQFEHGPEKLSG
jgi:hypothetical protein